MKCLHGPRLGTAGVTDARGNVVASTRPGVEEILYATLPFRDPA